WVRSAPPGWARSRVGGSRRRPGGTLRRAAPGAAAGAPGSDVAWVSSRGRNDASTDDLGDAVEPKVAGHEDRLTVGEGDLGGECTRLAGDRPAHHVAAAGTLHPLRLLHQPERGPGALGRAGQHHLLPADVREDPRRASGTPPGERQRSGPGPREDLRLAVDLHPYFGECIRELRPEREAHSRPLTRSREEGAGDSSRAVERLDEGGVRLWLGADARGEAVALPRDQPAQALVVEGPERALAGPEDGEQVVHRSFVRGGGGEGVAARQVTDGRAERLPGGVDLRRGEPGHQTPYAVDRRLQEPLDLAPDLLRASLDAEAHRELADLRARLLRGGGSLGQGRPTSGARRQHHLVERRPQALERPHVRLALLGDQPISALRRRNGV